MPVRGRICASRLSDLHWTQKVMFKVRIRAPAKCTTEIISSNEGPSSSSDKSQIHINKPPWLVSPEFWKALHLPFWSQKVMLKLRTRIPTKWTTDILSDKISSSSDSENIQDHIRKETPQAPPVERKTSFSSSVLFVLWHLQQSSCRLSTINTMLIQLGWVLQVDQRLSIHHRCPLSWLLLIIVLETLARDIRKEK